MTNACSLCAKIAADSLDLVCVLPHCRIFRGPFSAGWPGALMVVFSEHRIELSDLGQPEAVQRELLAIERAIRATVQPRRMNVAKFGNVCEHLHWHFIPRRHGEAFAEKTPWEIATPEPPPADWHPDEIYGRLAERLRQI